MATHPQNQLESATAVGTMTVEETLEESCDHPLVLQTIYPMLIERFDAKEIVAWMVAQCSRQLPELQSILSCTTAYEAADGLLKIISNEWSRNIYELSLKTLNDTYSDGDPLLVFTFDQPPINDEDLPRRAVGAVMSNKYLYVVYKDYNKVEVFFGEGIFQKLEDIDVEGLKQPSDIAGSIATSQLFISQCNSDVILRVNLTTGVSDAFVETGCKRTKLSLVDTRLLVSSDDLLLIFDISSGERLTIILLKENILRCYTNHGVYHAIESSGDSIFLSHGPSINNSTVSEIDFEGRELRVFNNEQKFDCCYLALDSFGRLFVTDLNNTQVVLLSEDLKFERILISNKQLNNSEPHRLNYNMDNNRLTVSLGIGEVMMFEY